MKRILLDIMSMVCGAALLLACSEKEPAPDAGSGNGGNGGGDTPKETGWFISPDGSDENSGKAPVFPLKTFDKVLSVIRPGDVVNIMPGRYEASGGPLIDLKPQHSGRDGEYITFRAYDKNDRPVFYAYGRGVWQAININASYIVIDGIEIEGNVSAISYEDAYANAEKYYSNPSGMDWAETAIYNTGGVAIGGTGKTSERPDHIIIRNCIVHDMPGGGLSAIQADYVTFEDNIIYNTCWRNMYGSSGISILTPVDNDDNTSTYKLVVRGNVCHNNRNEIPWVRANAFSMSDGNGIIIDVNNAPDASGVAVNEGPYKGRTLVCNNISFCNGGSGIHSFKANNVDIVNNTAYHNSEMYSDGSYAEIWTNQCENVNIFNNIMYARPGGLCNRATAFPTEVYSHNIYYGGEVMTEGEGDKVADPGFAGLSEELDADFHLMENSPAIGNGILTDFTPEIDKDGVERGDRIDAGAYQYVE